MVARALPRARRAPAIGRRRGRRRPGGDPVPPGAGVLIAPEPPPRGPFASRQDILRIPRFVATKLLYTCAQTGVILRLVDVGATYRAARFKHRPEFVQRVEASLGPLPSRRAKGRLIRRHLQARARHRFFGLWPQMPSFGRTEIRMDGLEHLDRAVREGRGVVLVSMHFGYARLIKPLLARSGRPVLLVGRDPEVRRRYGKDFFEQRFSSRLGQLVAVSLLRIPRESVYDERWMGTVGEDLPAVLNVRPLLDALRANSTLLVLADGHWTTNARPVDILGMRLGLAPGPFTMAAATGAAVLPAFVLEGTRGARLPRLVIHPPLAVQSGGDPGGDLDANLARFAEVCETCVRSHPHLWRWQLQYVGKPEQ